MTFETHLINLGATGFACFLGGLLIGILYTRLRFSRLKMTNAAETATLKETLRHSKAEIESMTVHLQQAADQNETLNGKLFDLAQNYAAAQVRLDRLPALEATEKKQEAAIAELTAANSDLKQKQAALTTLLDKERQAASEKTAIIDEIKNKMPDTFKMLSAGVLRENNQSFLDLAKTVLSGYFRTTLKDIDNRNEAIHNVIKPVEEALEKYDRQVKTMELAREKAYGSLKQQVDSLIQTQQTLQKETGNLVKSLRVPHVRGRWGEVTLKRVAELAGMQQHCDFFEQFSQQAEEGLLRPDMIVHLPENRKIVIDAKVPLTAYLDALDAETEEQKETLLAAHAKQVLSHIKQLAQKKYWRQFTPTPEFVVLFIPGENFFSAALSQNAGLIEEGVNQGVILATPTTLISLLKTVSYGWNQTNAAENARVIGELGKQLYQRLNLMVDHINRLGRDIDKCGQTYNQVVGSFEKRVMASARKFNDLGISSKDSEALKLTEPVQNKVRQIIA